MTDILDLLDAWMPHQRWYSSKQASPKLSIRARLTVPPPSRVRLRREYAEAARASERAGEKPTVVAEEPAPRLFVYFLLDEASEPPTLYQVPIAVRPDSAFDGDRYDEIARRDGELRNMAPARAAIGQLDDLDGERVVVADATHDPAFQDALMQLMLGGDDGALTVDSSTSVTGSAFVKPGRVRVLDAHVLRGEQSNTSIVYELDDSAGALPRRVICKVYRAIHAGENPDVRLQTAIARSGSALVPATLGVIEGEWPDPGQPSGTARGHLAMLQAFVEDGEDAWRAAGHALDSGHDFIDTATALGVAVAELHRVLARELGEGEGDPDSLIPAPTARTARERQLLSFDRRLGFASDEVKGLGRLRESIERVYRRARESVWPTPQRVHGDLHLGQVLLTLDGVPVILDFEGEPMRPMADRLLPDIALRDVAGMLRSFDYAAGAYERRQLVQLRADREGARLTNPGDAEAAAEGEGDEAEQRAVHERARAWADAARAAFLDGYARESGLDTEAARALLAACELDKAVYESLYEARNRPNWVEIPLDAVERLVADDFAAGEPESGGGAHAPASSGTAAADHSEPA